MTKPRKSYSYVEEWKRRWDPDLEAIGVNGNSCDPTKVDPKVLEWAKENCTENPHFIKVINSGAANGRPGLKKKNASSITVPSPFVREHFKRLGRVVTLENGRGKTWRVSFGAPKRDPQWLQGWEKVATDNDFRPGDVVVFVLVADSRFQFTLFDEDGNVRTLSEPSLKINTPQKVTELRPRKARKLLMPEPEFDSHPASTSTEELRRRAVLDPEIEPFEPLAFTFKSKRRLTTPSERQHALDAAMAHARLLTEHHFVAEMSKFHVYSNFHLVLPETFVTETCFPTSSTKLTLMNSDGNSWDMHSKQIKSTGVVFHRKFWAQFSLHHLLEEGDVCVFHLQNSIITQPTNSSPDKPVLRVHIFRVVPIMRMVPVHDHYETRRIEVLKDHFPNYSLTGVYKWEFGHLWWYA